MVQWLFLAAYGCSGFAGLIYEVSWTRLLTLELGHSTAAASTVVASFMCGLALGSVIAGRLASKLTPARLLYAYIILECGVAMLALAVPHEVAALKPLLAWAYRDGASNGMFAAVRLLSSLVIILIPAVALGATFPIAVQWYVNTAARSDHRGRSSGVLYAVNTVGAAGGALAAGFLLIPVYGVTGTTWVGVLASGVAVTLTGIVLSSSFRPTVSTAPAVPRTIRRPTANKRAVPSAAPARETPWWLAAFALAITGFSGLLLEIVWMRVLSLVVGPTTYAFSATLAALITGLACGSAGGSVIAGRARYPAFWLTASMGIGAIATAWAARLGGSYLPEQVAQRVAESPDAVAQLLSSATLGAAALIIPAAICLGAAFPLGLEVAGGGSDTFTRRVGIVYAINTLAALGGALGAGFVTIPVHGIEHSLQLVSGILILGGAGTALAGRLPRRLQIAGFVPIALALAFMGMQSRWDRELLSSGVYSYASYVQRGMDIESALTAGDLLYYKDGAAATVSVKRLTGTLSLSIDGKIDASNAGDMLTQKALAHLPLLLHPDPKSVLVIGLGSGVTLGSALVHPIARADVVELSPEVVAAARYFDADSGRPLDDSRAHLIVGDGRSHMLLTSRRYDVIISEPSNPWIAGVASLFTREFFEAARQRLEPGGIICQWAHTYDISDADLRSIVATFNSVFPGGTLWLLGEGDVLLVASTSPLEPHLDRLEQAWLRPGVAADLAKVSALDPFAFWSLYVGGENEMGRYAAGAPLQSDDRMALEFSGPRSLSNRAGRTNANQLLELRDPGGGPPVIKRAIAAAGAAQWRNRAAMLFGADDYASAYDDYAKALAIDPADQPTLDGLVRAAQAAGRVPDALDLLKRSFESQAQSAQILVAASKLLASAGEQEAAVAAAEAAADVRTSPLSAADQLASIYADAGDAPKLDAVIEQMRKIAPESGTTRYYRAVAAFLSGRFDEALTLGTMAAEGDARDADTQNLVGAAYASLGRQSEARSAFQRALRLNGKEATTYNNLGLLELNAGNAALAANYFAEALWLDAKSPAALDGWSKARQALAR